MCCTSMAARISVAGSNQQDLLVNDHESPATTHRSGKTAMPSVPPRSVVLRAIDHEHGLSTMRAEARTGARFLSRLDLRELRRNRVNRHGEFHRRQLWLRLSQGH